MGCINSTKKITELKNDNVFRVVRLQPEVRACRSGFLEVTPRELVFAAQGREQLVWALQHLRRYGLNGDIFSFEAGRRCMAGPGIYTFRCEQADRLYQLFQRHVNAVSLVTDDVFVFSDRDREGIHPSHTLERPDNIPHTNNYLEPVPMTMTTIRTTMNESFSSSPLSLELDSPDSVPSLSLTNEVVHFQNHPSTPGAYVNTSSNVYLDHPLRLQAENNNNMARINTGNSSGFSTMSRKTLGKRSLDVPPEECAPMLSLNNTLEDLHMYANVENMGAGTRERLLEGRENSNRCYENINHMDLPLLLPPPPPPSCNELSAKEDIAPAAAVNYIVLDLDQPRSPTPYSPKMCFGSAFSLPGERAGDPTSVDAQTQTPPAMATLGNANAANAKSSEGTESPFGYSTIDFIKTCALIKSSTHGADFEPDHDHEESRITRHSKCVRKAYSISD